VKYGGTHPDHFVEMVYEPRRPARTMIAGIGMIEF
jgi:hypothetical protein